MKKTVLLAERKRLLASLMMAASLSGCMHLTHAEMVQEASQRCVQAHPERSLSCEAADSTCRASNPWLENCVEQTVGQVQEEQEDREARRQAVRNAVFAGAAGLNAAGQSLSHSPVPQTHVVNCTTNVIAGTAYTTCQ